METFMRLAMHIGLGALLGFAFATFNQAMGNGG